MLDAFMKEYPFVKADFIRASRFEVVTEVLWF